MGTHRHQKTNVSKREGSEITKSKRGTGKKILRVARNTFLTLFGISTPLLLNAQAKDAQLPINPAQEKVRYVASNENVVPANTYGAKPDSLARNDRTSPDRDARILDAMRSGKKIEPDPKKPKLTKDGYEILDKMTPSDVIPEIGTKTITMRHYAFIDVDGIVIRGDGSPDPVYLNDSQWKSLGAEKFDGNEIRIVLKSQEYGYVHYLLHPDWKGILQIMEPKFKDRKCGAIHMVVVEPKSEICKPLVFLSDSLSILVAEDIGLVGEIRGQEGELDLTTTMLFIKKVNKPSFIKTKVNGKDVILFDPGDASKKKLGFYLDEQGLITGEMDPID